MITTFVPKEEKNENPSVGEYEMRGTLFHKKQKYVSFPATFGSSQRKEVSYVPQNNIPGPGSYDVQGKFKKPPKYVMKTTTSSLKPPS